MQWLLKLIVTSTLLMSILCGSPSRAQEALAAPEIVNLSLPIDGSPTDVVTHIYKPNSSSATAFPLVIYSHGRNYNPNPLNPSDISTPHIKPEVANWWLQKGFAVVAPLRPGYGETGGFDRENQFIYWQGSSCITEPKSINPLYGRAAVKAREVVLATLTWAQTQPWVKRDRIVLVGQSVGGMTTIATAAINPEGVIAGINFAGGMGGNPTTSPRKSCQPEQLTTIYGQYGKTTRVPTLWLYAENDLFWGPDFPKQWFDAFKTGGSDATFVQTPPVPGEVNGHTLINTGGPLWKPEVDIFLKKLKF
jgi:dienelactone hydrolase